MSASLTSHRLSSIDLLRGIIMVIMALDHTRDYFHIDAFVFSPTDLTKTNTALFFTRWITHYCLPGFVLLAGTSVYLSLQRKSKKELSWFLLSRGLWMILLEFTVMRFGYFFNFYFDVTILSVLWLFGVCMIAMAALIYLSNNALLIIGLALVTLHDLSILVQVPTTSPAFPLWTIFLTVGFLPVTPDFAFLSSYAILPWLGVMLLGYSLGRWYEPHVDPTKRQRWLLNTGLGCVVLFILIRFINVYGDPNPWSIQPSVWYTVLSLLNATKNPVSLVYTFMTLGPLFIALSVLERAKGTWQNFFVVFGRVPLFYFILHFYLIHVLALATHMIRTGKSWAEIDLHFNKSFGGIPPGEGVSLFWTYVVYAAVVLMMYPLCNWYNRMKSRSTSKWLSYL